VGQDNVRNFFLITPECSPGNFGSTTSILQVTDLSSSLAGHRNRHDFVKIVDLYKHGLTRATMLNFKIYVPLQGTPLRDPEGFLGLCSRRVTQNYQENIFLRRVFFLKVSTLSALVR
jgi:hypothetical protein